MRIAQFERARRMREENVAALLLYQEFGFKKVQGSETVNRAGGTSSTMRWDCSQASFIASN